MTVLDFRLRGPMQLHTAAGPAAPPGAAEGGLLARLLLSPGRAVAASSLIDRLWGETTLPADPVNALQLRVSKLRRALAVHGVEVTRASSGYVAEVDPEQVDLHRFVHRVQAARAVRRNGAGEQADAVALYDEALAQWRGDPLADFAGEPWATVEAARLQQLRLAAQTERAEAALGLGRAGEVAADLEPLVADDPRQEALAGLLMTALYRSGRQAEALEVFERTRRCLDDELGLLPSAALRALHSQVLQQDPELAPVATPQPAPAAAAPPASRTLPVPSLRLVGRDDELQSLEHLLATHRLVTLVGPGGAGKTSLAVAAADAVADRFEQRVHLARLAAVGRAADVPLAVAESLGVPLDGADPNAHVRSRLLAYLAHRRLLLVLDNCEHVVDAVAALADGIVTGAPGVTLLATSREALGVPGEVQVSVAPLACPPADAPASDVASYPAAALFLERAHAAGARRTWDEADLQALTRVCARLDGMPLALELAAARMSALSLPELAERLDDRFGLLTTGPRTADARQRTLRATVEWSHALLSEPERQVFRRLAAFHGGWSLAAAEAVAAGGDVSRGDVLDVLGHLVNRSMVVADAGHPTRYRMLETLRQYAGDELALSGEADEVAGRHAAYFRRLADDAERTLRGNGQRQTLTRLREEHPNLRAALSWLAADPDRLDDGLQLAAALGLYWHLGRHVEGREVLRDLVARPGGTPLARARALQAVSIVERPRACLVHPSPRCAQTARDSLELFSEIGDAHRAALSRVLLAVELLDGSDAERLESLLAQAEQQFSAESDEWGHAVVAFVRLQAFLRAGDEARARVTGRVAADAFRRLDEAWGLSAVLYHLGWGLKEFGQYAEAVPVLEQAIEVATSAGLFNTVQWALSDLGMALLHLGDAQAAATCFDRAAAASLEIGDAAGEVLAALGRASLAQAAGDAAAARPLFEVAHDGLRRLQTPLWAGHALAGIAWCDWREGMLEESKQSYDQVRGAGEQSGEPTLVATGLEGLARVAAAGGDITQARDHLDRAAQVRVDATRPAPPHEAAELAELNSGALVVPASHEQQGIAAR